MERSVSSQPIPEFVIRGLSQLSSSVTALSVLTIDSNEYLICGTDCGQLSIWSLLTYRCHSAINTENKSRVQHLIAFEDQLLCQFKSGVIDVFDKQLSLQKSYSMSDSTYCKCFLYSKPNSDNNSINRKYLAFVSKANNRFIEIIDLNTDKSVLTVGPTDSTYGWPFTLFIAPLGTSHTESDIVLVLIGCENGFIIGFKADLTRNESQLVTQLKCFESIITAMDFNIQRKSGICCSVTDVICVWTLSSNEDKSSVELSLKSNIKVTNSGLLCCAIRSDGRVFACGGSDGRVRVFAMKSLKALAVIDSHKQTIECLVFSHQLLSKQMHFLLAIGSKDKTISVWDLYNNL